MGQIKEGRVKNVRHVCMDTKTMKKKSQEYTKHGPIFYNKKELIDWIQANCVGELLPEVMYVAYMKGYTHGLELRENNHD